MKKQILLGFFALFGCAALAQSPACYQDFRSEGLRLMDTKDYGAAINQFVAALVACKDLPPDHDLSKQIKRAQNIWVGDLQESVAREQKAYREALAAKERADSAQVAEGKARRDAEANAQKARQQGIKAESLRLALLADMARQRGQKSDAVLLSWMALQLSGAEWPPFVVRAFGEAVRDSFSNVFFNGNSPIEAAVFLPGGQKVLLRNAEGAHFVVGLGEKPSVAQLPKDISEITVANQSERLLGWARGAQTVRLLDAAGQVLATLEGHTAGIRQAIFSPDDNQILTCSRDRTARLWSLKGAQLAVYQQHSATVQDAQFAPDGSYVVTRDAGGSGYIQKLDGTPMGLAGSPMEFLVDVDLLADGQYLVSKFANGSVRFVNAQGGAGGFLAIPDERVESLAFATKAARVAACGKRKVALFDPLESEALVTVEHKSEVRGAALNAAGTRLLTWANDRVLRLWDLRGNPLQTFVGHRGAIVAAVFSPDENYLLTTAKDGTAKLWDLSGNLLTEWMLGTENPAPATFSPDGQYVMTAIQNGKSLALAPIPMDVYRSVQPEKVLKAESTPQVLQAYNVQYTEELGKRH
jgi:WD40 repeat protein